MDKKDSYAVTKRRAGKAPEGSGAPVGTAYRWYILAHQIVTEFDANSYSTEMVGLKHKLAHKRADKASWSASETAQRRRLVQILRELAQELENSAKEQPVKTPVASKSRAEENRKLAPRARRSRRAAAWLEPRLRGERSIPAAKLGMNAGLGP